MHDSCKLALTYIACASTACTLYTRIASVLAVHQCTVLTCDMLHARKTAG